MGKQVSGAAKRKKKKEREKALAEHVANLERLKLGPTKLWTGLVLHHKDVFVSHVISKLNRTDRCLFSFVNTESQDVLEYAGVNLSELDWTVYDCSSISTLEWEWNHFPWGRKSISGSVMDQAWFCSQVAATNKYFVEERKIPDSFKLNCVGNDALYGRLDCLKYLVEEAKVPLNDWQYIASARYYEQRECENYLLEKECPEPTDEGYADFVQDMKELDEQQ